MPLLQALIGLFEMPEDDTIPDDEHFIDVEDTPGKNFDVCFPHIRSNYDLSSD